MQHRRSSSRRQASVDIPKYAPQIQQLQVAQQPDLVQISDYESDIPIYNTEFPSKSPSTSRTVPEMNYAVIKRHYPEVTSIMAVAPYAVIYEFSPIPEPTWTKSGVEGSLFICTLTPGEFNEDRFTAIVLNRRGLENFQAQLLESEAGGVEITDQYVIISVKEAHEQKIWGVFMWSDGPGTSTEHTRSTHAELMKSLARMGGVSRHEAEINAANARAQHANGHVQEAEEAVQDISPPSKSSASLLQLFSKNRREDAGAMTHTHGFDGTADPPTPLDTASTQAQLPAPSQPDVLGNLFRRAGLTLK